MGELVTNFDGRTLVHTVVGDDCIEEILPEDDTVDVTRCLSITSLDSQRSYHGAPCALSKGPPHLPQKAFTAVVATEAAPAPKKISPERDQSLKTTEDEIESFTASGLNGKDSNNCIARQNGSVCSSYSGNSAVSTKLHSAGQGAASTTVSGAPQLLSWLDTEVKVRLTSMEKKLDRLLQYADRPMPNSQAGHHPPLESHHRESFLTVVSPITSPRSTLAPISNPPRPPTGTYSAKSSVATCSRTSLFFNSKAAHLRSSDDSLVDAKGTDSMASRDIAFTSCRSGIDEEEDNEDARRSDMSLFSRMQASTHIDRSRSLKEQKLRQSTKEMKGFLGIQPAVEKAPTFKHQKHQSAVGHILSSAKQLITSTMVDKRWSVGLFSSSMITRRRRNPGIIRRARCESLWHFLEDQESSTPALWYSECMIMFTMLTVFCTIVQSTEPPVIHGWGAAILESSFDTVFLLEFLIRFLACPNWCHFVTNPFNFLDMLLGLVLFLRVAAGFNMDDHPKDSLWRQFFLLFLPTLRMMKTLRRFQKLTLIFKAFEQAVEALPVLLWTLMVAVITFSTLIFCFEPRDNVPTWTKAIWLTIVTMSTVGYGDVYPVSPGGTIVTVVLIILSVLYMAMPIGIIGQTFGSIWLDRDRILLMQSTRRRLLEWGYTAEDIPIIFSLFDEDFDGEMNHHEFRKMIEEMGLGFKDERIFELWNFLNDDGEGSVTDEEFVRNVFPNEFHRLFQVDTQQLDDVSVRIPATSVATNPTVLQNVHGRPVGDSEIAPHKNARLSMNSAQSGATICAAPVLRRKSMFVRRQTYKQPVLSEAAAALKSRLSERTIDGGSRFASMLSGSSTDSAFLPSKKELDYPSEGEAAHNDKENGGPMYKSSVMILASSECAVDPSETS